MFSREIARMKKDWWNREFRKLVTLGESTTAGGWASCPQRAWPSRLAGLINEFQRAPVQLINVGIGGNVISTKSCGYEPGGKPAAIERLDKHVFAHEPDLLIISYGLNDAYHGTPLDLFCSEMRALIARVREVIRPLIVLAGPYYMYAFDYPDCAKADLGVFIRFNEGIKKVAAETDCLFADLLSAYDEADWLVHRDGVHANDLGHQVVANKIFEVLAANCSGLALETREMEKEIPPWRDESALRRDCGVHLDGKPTPRK